MNKTDKLLELYKYQLDRLMTQPEEYDKFIRFAAPLYKYHFSEIVLIYASRPSATLCAEFEFWTTKMGLSLKGAKGIPVIRNFYGQNRIAYLFDVADVGMVSGRQLPSPWNTSNVPAEHLVNLVDPHDNLLLDRLGTRFGCYVAQLENGDTKERLLMDTSVSITAHTAKQIVCARVGLPVPHEKVSAITSNPTDYITSNTLLFSAVKVELTNIKNNIDEYRRNNHEQHSSTDTGRGTGDNIRGDTGAAGNIETIGTLRNNLAAFYGEQQTFGGNGAAIEQLSVQQSARGGDSLAEQGNRHNGNDAQGEGVGTPNNNSRESSAREPVESIGDRNGKRGFVAGADEQSQLTLFGASTVDPEVITALPVAVPSTSIIAVIDTKDINSANFESLARVPLVHNFRITDHDSLFPTGSKDKFKRNVAAIELLKRIESRDGVATAEEQAVLTQYSGWGGIPQAFDKDNANWIDEFEELCQLLSPEEYTQARASTLNAHYTSPMVIKSIYAALHNMGFRQGRVLEPALGVGYFFGLMPEEMSGSELHGVELDAITGRIARLLYPQANIQIAGFQQTSYPPEHFDVLVSNVPFGDYNISDDKYSMHIHDYFFAKGLDSLRTGGVMAFITSKGTLDKMGSTVRRQIAQRADLLGAVRLPNSAFRRIAGTEVTTDIVFLQKRAVPPEELPDWVYLAPYPSNPEISVNSYYVDNPHMMLGTMVERSGMYGGKDTALTPSATWEVDLLDRINSVQGSYQERSAVVVQEKSNAADLPDDGTTPKFTYCVKDDNLYYCDRVMLRYQSFDKTKTARIKGMNDIRLATRAVIAVQQDDTFTPQALADCHTNLNTVYDQFVKKYGNINSRANQLAFADDIDIALISSLESINEDGTYRKAEFFSKATIKRTVRALYADTAQDALSISLNEKSFVDLEYMQLLTGLTKARLVEDLGERIYLDHKSTLESPRYVTAEEYLSGDVRTALYEVMSLVEERPELRANLQALEIAQPEWIPAIDIGVKLSSNWVGAETVNQFIYGLMSTPKIYQGSEKQSISAVYNRHNNAWTIYNKGAHKGLVATAKYGTDRMSAYYIIEAILNQREVTVRDAEEEDGKTVYKYNHEETVAARQKQEVINESFNDWIFADADRRNKLEHIYNHTFNRTRPRVYDGSYLTLPEANPHISLTPHQLNAVARIRTGGSTLLAHVVGAGKTYAMVAGGMELLRLKVAHKLLYVVPNHLIGDFAQDFLKLYPTANVLVPSDKDFEKSRRYRFIAKIATADIDAIVIGHSQFEKIDITPERKAMEIKRELEALEHVLESVNSEETPRYTVKQLEKTRQSLIDRMNNLLSSKDKDGMLYFEELGVDCLFVDEAHNYKNGALNSKMSNISGVSSSSSLKASDMLAKTRYLTEIGASVVYATGTCVSNSICELYVMQRYLQEESLQRRDIYHFDEWASNFGETVTSIEVKPEGGGYRSKTRFAQFFNLPELMNMFTEVADIQTAEMLNLERPELEGGKAIVVACKPSQELLEFMNVCVSRAQDIRSGAVKSHQDNMLKLTNEARKAGTDMRLLGEQYSFDPNGKIAMCAENIVSDLNDTKDFRGTVLVFSDIGTPSEKFNVYDELRRLLVLRGVPEGEIAFIHEAKNGTDRKKLFKDMRTGVKRVLVGSTQKCGAGTNIQKRLYSLHDLDCPWRPSEDGRTQW